jgi:hypothetical protein
MHARAQPLHILVLCFLIDNVREIENNNRTFLVCTVCQNGLSSGTAIALFAIAEPELSLVIDATA